jgi:6-pyruvoyl-tetrahydropterin synthase
MITLFVNRLTVIDLSFLDPRLGLLGESWQVDIEMDGSLDHQGMVLDFGEVKRQVKKSIDEHFDHKLLVPALHPGCEFSANEHRCETLFTLNSGERLRHSAPVSATALIETSRITGESLTRAIIGTLKPGLPDNVHDLRINLHTEQVDGAWYRYSHGLKHHAGNCQRIAHGHRSRIMIYRDGQRDLALERQWARRWENVYIATRADLLDSFGQDGVPFYRFGYTARQGLFEMELPQRCCYLVDTDSTVENLAQHIADSLKRAEPDSSFRVLAFEGVDKGAVGTA